MIRKYIKYSLICAAVIALTSCTEKDILNGEGTLHLQVGVTDRISVTTRAMSDELQDSLQQHCTISIFSDKGVIRRYTGVNEVPGALYLSSGSYTAQVIAGDSVPASFETKFYREAKPFDINSGEVTNLNLTCGIANTVVAVKYDEVLRSVFQTYKVTVSSVDGTLNYLPESKDSIGYYMLPEDDRTLSWKLEATTPDGKNYTKEENIKDVKSAYRYDLSFNFVPTEYEVGGGMVQVSVNAEPIKTETEEVQIYQRPIFQGVGFDITSSAFYEINQGTKLEYTVTTTAFLKELSMSCRQLADCGLPAQMNLMKLTPMERGRLKDKGLEFVSVYNAGSGMGTMTVTFSDHLMKQITAKEGTYNIVLHATDARGRTNEGLLSISASDATVLTKDALEGEVWTSKATLRGGLMKETAEPLTFRYRAVGSSSWEETEATLTGKELTASVTGLKVATTYEYVAVAGEKASSVVCKFTTEKAAQLPNSGFENWHGSKPAYVFESGGTMFWDTGNHGSKKASVDITTSDDAVKHSGNYAAKLESKFASMLGIGQFAAGNIFTGKYLETKMDGVTGNGVIGWGRPFNSRPTALHGYVRYISATVDNDNNCDYINTGDPDIGSIFIVLGNWPGESYGGETWPVIVKTNFKNINSAQLFDVNSEYIIGYGEKDFTSSTEGEGMIEFTIPVDYRYTNRKPTAIIIVASSSKYGDYFSGGVGSTMWLDDLELVYE
ncbi:MULTISPECIES: DUF4493 domain-containing protein [Bacteroides]|jgi:hypothetical protein|uniref:DUF4493 domain-containing protein n=1 Tax=Bacteroides TaxID=816 RepID=UPI000E42EC5E|nr:MULTISPECIES: DUF4493 domain-containing protein [Bacteroides]MBS7575599.1 DUF4493 domain-containing protein [Bacteroides propionicigenes]RGM30058.1 DUF4493 domain-containing protein [Bacteroides sp. OM08-17BH]RHJ52918.1 DUF4493 domain-containing protein [Bacteroides sp. AM10-21B]HBO07844.1 hypothetical protein [Bacteroides sp.]